MSENYFVINDFMIKELKLKGNDLLVYAKLYSFYTNYKRPYNYGVKHLSKELGITEKATYNSLDRLNKKMLIGVEFKDVNIPNRPYFYVVDKRYKELELEHRLEMINLFTENNLVSKWFSTENNSANTEKITDKELIIINNIKNNKDIIHSDNIDILDKVRKDVFCPYLDKNSVYRDMGFNVNERDKVISFRITRNKDFINAKLMSNINNILRAFNDLGIDYQLEKVV